jgi:signal transduction histidine kinase
MVVRDDGIGFDPTTLRKRARRVATLGLLGMQERAHAAGGVLEIDSKLTIGTEVRFSVPVDNPHTT